MSKKLVPNIRFKGFDREWKESLLNEKLIPSREKNTPFCLCLMRFAAKHQAKTLFPMRGRPATNEMPSFLKWVLMKLLGNKLPIISSDFELI